MCEAREERFTRGGGRRRGGEGKEGGKEEGRLMEKGRDREGKGVMREESRAKECKRKGGDPERGRGEESGAVNK